MRRYHVISVVLVLILMIAASTYTSGQTPDQAATPDSGSPETKLEDFSASNFGSPTNIANKWFPLKPGMQFVYDGVTSEDGKLAKHHVEFTVTDLTKVISSVRTVVGWEQDFGDGQLVETELVFFAQDNDGAVWQIGEYPEVFEKGKLVEIPTWIHGVKDGRAGIVMKANPQPGTPSYSQGWSPAVQFSDRAQVDRMTQETCVPVTCYKDVLIIKEYNLEEPSAFQFKYYAQGVGNIRVDWSGSDKSQEKLELVKVDQLNADALAAARAEALKLEKHAYEVSKDVYGQTSPAEQLSTAKVVGAPAAQATAVPTAGAAAPDRQPAATQPKVGHWQGKVSRADGDTIVFDVAPEGEVDNIEVELTLGGAKCTADVELTPLNPDGTFTLVAESGTNGVRGQFGSATTASGTVTLHDCAGNPVPATSGKDVYNWTAEWVSNEIG